jgi:hypothetical protein
MIGLLKKLHADVSFRPDAGEFLSKLIEMAIDNAEEERAELFSAHNCDVQVSFSSRTIEEGTIRFLVVSDLGNQSLKCDLATLNGKETRDLAGQLSRLIAEQSPPKTLGAQKIIVRKNVTGMLDSHHAAQKIGCSQIFLKSKIPCTDYTYREVDGKKEIIEYYWSNSLIDRLCYIKLNGVKTEDVENIAKECCDGDCTWAEEILLSLGCSESTPKVLNTPPNVIKKPSDKITPNILKKRWHSRKKNP